MLDNLILMLLAVDGMEGDVQDSVDNTVDSVDNTPNEESQETEIPEHQHSNISEFEIDGEKLTLEQIRSFKQSSMKATELFEQQNRIKQMEEQNKDAIELFNYLKNKPDLAQKLYELDNSLPQDKLNKLNPYEEKIASLEQKFVMKEIETELNEITSKDKDVTDMELLEIATKNNCSVKNAYNIWRGMNFDKILEKRLSEQSKKITENIKKNNGVTKTIITEGDKVNNADITHGLSDVELAFAKKVGMTPEEYSKWK